MAKGQKKGAGRRGGRGKEEESTIGGDAAPSIEGSNMLGLASAEQPLPARSPRNSAQGRPPDAPWFGGSDWDLPGAPTARGGAGGGWDIASSYGGTAASAAAPSVSGVSTKRSIVTFMEETTTTSGVSQPPTGKRGSKLSTVPEAPTISESQAFSVRDSFNSAGNPSVAGSPPIKMPDGQSFMGSRGGSPSVRTHHSSVAPSIAKSVVPSFTFQGPSSPGPATSSYDPPPGGGSQLGLSMPAPSTGLSFVHGPTGTPSPGSPPGVRNSTNPSIMTMPVPTPGPPASASGSGSAPGSRIQATSLGKDGEGGKTVTFVQVSYSGGGPDSSVVGLPSKAQTTLQLIAAQPPTTRMIMGSGTASNPRSSGTGSVQARSVSGMSAAGSVAGSGRWPGGFAGPGSMPHPGTPGPPASHAWSEDPDGSVDDNASRASGWKGKGKQSMDARSSVGHGSAVGSAWRVGSEVDSGWAAGSSRSGSVAGAGEWGWEGGPTTAPSWTARPALRSSSSSHYPAPPPPPAPTITTPPTSPPPIGLRPPTIIPTSRPATVAPTKRSPSPVSQAMQRAMMSTPDPPRPQPTHDARIQESGGLALKPAQRAMFGRHRHAMERFIWTLDTEHDERVQGLIDWIGVMGWALSSLALSKFLAWRQRGALFANADFRPWKHPEEPAFDWMTFDEVQNTLDKTLQESIATYDPHTTALVFVFLVSKTGSSVGIWRRKVSVPPSLQLKHANEIESVKKELERKGGVVVKVERPLTQKPPPIPMATPPPEASPPYMPIALPPPPPPTTAIVVSSPEVKVVKKRRWWQFWKKRERGKEKVDVMRERGKLSKRR